MAQEFGTPVAPPERRRNTGLIVTIIVLLLLCCCCATIAILYFYLGDIILEWLEEQGIFLTLQYLRLLV